MLHHAPNFTLEQYLLAQALDHFYLMDDDTTSLTLTESYNGGEVVPDTDVIPLKSIQTD